MSSVPIALRPIRATAGRPAAWFVPGSEPRAWLDEILGWGVPLGDLALLVVPRSARDRTARGVLVLVGDSVPASPRRASPWVGRAERLYHPADAALDPPMTDQEIVDGLVYDLGVLHPVIGLIGFGREDVLGIGDLVVPAEPGAARWGDAVAGAPLAKKLHGVSPEHVLTVEEVLEGGREEIGDTPLSQLEPTPEERAADRRAIGDAVVGYFARGAKWFTERAPGGASSRTWVNAVEDWANGRIAGLLERLELRRNRELHRLLELLERDPDAGLRHALPIGGRENARGVAPPGDVLGDRDVDFDLRRLRAGGGPGDAWRTEKDVHLRLHQQYRELANREIRLGRYRRAAYIYAHLLGDLPAAAATLRDGGHFREAAVLYRDELSQPLEAARCLAGGGFLVEAAALYAAEEHHEQAGDLYREVDQDDHARREYQAAVAELERREDVCDAARVIAVKLDRPEEAMAALAAAWPRGRQAERAMRMLIVLLGRSEQHGRARRLIEALKTGATRDELVTLAEILAATSRDYPDPALRAEAADSARVIAGRLLPDEEPARARVLLDVVEKLAPDDVLLRRDTRRLFDRLAARRPQPRAAIKPLRRGPQPRREITLPRISGEWLTAAATAEGVLLSGVDARGDAVITWLPWHGRPITAPLDISARRSHHLGTAPGARNFLWTGLVGGELEAISVVPTEDVLSMAPLQISGDTRGVAWGHDGLLWLARRQAAGLVIQIQDEQDSLLRTTLIGDFALHPGMLPVVANQFGVFVAIDERVVVVSPSGVTQNLELGAPITSLAPTSPHTVPRVLVGLARGACVISCGAPERPRVYRIAAHLEAPIIGLSYGGHVVVAGPDEAQVYRASRGGVRHVASFSVSPREHRIAIVRGPHADQVALVSSNYISIVQL